MLWDSDEVIWYSQRSDWGNLYLYDLQSGELKNAITSGEGPVTKIVHVDEEARQLWYTANGREAGQDPYFAHGYRVSLDGGDAVSLTPENGTHTIGLSPSCGYLVDTFSRPEVAPVTVLRDVTDGAVLMTLEVIARNISELWAALLRWPQECSCGQEADTSALEEAGWKPPTPITVKADDGETDLYVRAASL